MKQISKNQKGITMIMLIITIIVMIILAGISIKVVTEQQIIETTNDAVHLFDEDAKKEEENLIAFQEEIKQQSLNNNNNGDNNGNKPWWETTDSEKQQINEAEGLVAWNGEGSEAGGRVCAKIEGCIYIILIEEDVTQYYLFAYNDTGIRILNEEFYRYDNYEKYKWYNLRIDLQMASGSNKFLEGIYTGDTPIKKDEFTIISCEDYLDRILSSFNK